MIMLFANNYSAGYLFEEYKNNNDSISDCYFQIIAEHKNTELLKNTENIVFSILAKERELNKFY